MKEELLHFIWKFRLYNHIDLQTVAAEKVSVKNPGLHNKIQGPDFSEASITIGQTLWAGNVEIHQKTSDFVKHNHQKDEAYKNLILHVVYEHDYTPLGHPNVPILELKGRIKKQVVETYNSFIENHNPIPCSQNLHLIDAGLLSIWFERLLIEKLESKMEQIDEIYNQSQQDYAETFYRFLARSFGFKYNAQAMQMLATSIALNTIAKHKTNIVQIEALFFGQSGLLAENVVDDYSKQLYEEFLFLKNKFKPKPLEAKLWKFGGLRPYNFPTIRIAQFASLIFNSTALLSYILEEKKLLNIRKKFEITPSAYWETHFTFGKESAKKSKKLGKSAIDGLLINTVIPFLFFYGKKQDNEKMVEKAFNWLEQIKAETNYITLQWNKLEIKATNAFESQALIHLTNNYCAKKHCLECNIGNQLLKNGENSRKY
jgi:hypothetical protein